MCLNGPDLKPVLYHLMAPVVRERELMDMTMSTVENPMKELVHEISKVLKKKVGHEEYSKEAVRITGKLMEKRAERKNKRAQEVCIKPQKNYYLIITHSLPGHTRLESPKPRQHSAFNPTCGLFSPCSLP